MADIKNPRLTGGTLLNLILAIRKTGEISQKDKIAGKKSVASIPDVIAGLVRIVEPNRSVPNPDSAAVSATNYRKCECEAPSWMGIDDPSYVDAFSNMLENDYSTLLRRTDAFARTFLDIDTKSKSDFLGKSILGLICADPEIGFEDKFYIEGPNCPWTKQEMTNKSHSKFNLQMLILAAWYYVVAHAIPNRDGAETFKAWYTKKNGQERSAYPVTEISSQFKNSMIVVLSPLDSNMGSKGVASKTEGEKSAALAIDYDEYMSAAFAFYGSLKTIMYKESVPFYDFFVPSKLAGGQFFFDFDGGIEGLEELFGDPGIVPSSVFQVARAYGNCFAITATGGMGKSMTMRHFFLKSIQQFQESGTKGNVPVFMPLKDFKETYSSIADFAYAQIKKFTKKISFEQFAESLEMGRAILIMDGLDEVSEKIRADFMEKLNEITGRYSSNVFVLSTRPSDSLMNLCRFSELRLRPFELDQALELIDKLNWRPDEPKIKADFKKKLKESYWNEHRSFAQNPLLLTIMFMTYDQYQNIPDRMYRFYEYAYVTLSEKHDAMKAYARDMKTGLDSGEFQTYLEAFCIVTYTDEKYEFNNHEMEHYFEEMLEVMGKDEAPFSWKDFRDDLKDNLCLLYLESNKYHFVHRSFQEYFAACYFAKQNDDLLLEIAGSFERRKGGQRGDQTFGMLYEMIPDKIEQFVFTPYLESWLGEETEWDEFGIPNAFKAFVQKVYPSIIWSEGEVDEWTDFDSPSFIYNFILRHIGSKHRRLELEAPVPEDESLIISRYRTITSDEGSEIFNIDSFVLDSEEERKSLEESATGWVMRAPSALLYENPDDYFELLTAIEESDIFKEYKALKDYLSTLKGKAVHQDKNIRSLIFRKKK